MALLNCIFYAIFYLFTFNVEVKAQSTQQNTFAAKKQSIYKQSYLKHERVADRISFNPYVFQKQHIQNGRGRVERLQQAAFKKKKPEYPYQRNLNKISKEQIKEMQQNYYLSLPPMQSTGRVLLKQKVHPKINTAQIVSSSKKQQRITITQKKKQNQALNKANKTLNRFSSFQLKCPQNYVISYIWISKSVLPVQYQNLIDKCKDSVHLLTQEDLDRYTEQWNDLFETKINLSLFSIRYHVNLCKLLFLYFESGIYSDFDTQIDQACFDHIQSDEMIFGNLNLRNQNINTIIPQENFMYVQHRYNVQVEEMILRIIRAKNEGRWDQCVHRQCQILQCLHHFRDNTYLKGYD